MLAPDIETISWGRFALASFTVVGLISLLAVGLKLFASRGWIRPSAATSRLKFLTSLSLDSRRRLVLTRCDDKEYLLLLGGNNDLLLSSSPIPPASDKKTP
ncbi:MAG TPA: hypothetical protein DD400_00220 [Rhodospirillaceae bacterium]|nr:hypothetical protein [Rhodospirillaceae bacterium]